MNEHARKPDEAPTSISQRVGRVADALPVDDPSIPVLTERLTLPPLDLDLDFKLPPAPVAETDATRVAPREAPAAPPAVERIDGQIEEPAGADTQGAVEEALPIDEEANELIDESIDHTPGGPSTTAPAPEPAATPNTVTGQFDTQQPVTVTGAHAAPDLEPTLLAPRVPTSLLAASVVAKTETPTEAPIADHELTATGAWGPNRVETDLREMILLDLARRLPSEVEAIVRRYLEGAIDEAVRRFAAETRIALAASMREMVDRAVKAELERLRSGRR